jgi:uncharacterized membrane protein
LLAAIPGFVDFYALKQGAVKKIAFRHMLINLSAVVLFSINFYLRTGAPEAAAPFILSIIGVGSILVSGWLGGQMVYVHGLGVDESQACAPEEGVRAKT